MGKKRLESPEPRRRLWDVSFGDPGRGLYGVTLWDDHKVIVDPKRQTAEETFDTAVHEALHVAYPDLSEEAIQRGSCVVMNVLKALNLLPEGE